MHQIAVNGLRDRFPEASLRLLSDLVEEAASPRDEGPSQVDASIVVALDRPVKVFPLQGPARVLLPGAAYVHEDAPLDSTPVRVGPIGAEPARWVAFSGEAVRRAAAASPALARVLAPGARAAAEAATELVWVCGSPGVRVPLEAITQLLVASIARQFGEPAAMLVLGDERSELLGYDGERFVDLGFPATPARATLGAVLDRLTRARPEPFARLFVVGTDAGSGELPPGFGATRFHRVVYVTDAVPDEIPARLAERLRGGTPSFCSFLTSIVPGGAPSRGPASEPIVEAGPPGRAAKRRAARALRRDACRIPFDLPSLAMRWQAMERAGVKLAFVHAATRDDQLVANRWARAVTNRQVGLALSGGGASSYRVVPLIRALHERGVPIDVVSGVSGGALVGAYYCHDGLRGLDRCIDRGTLLQAGILAAVVRPELVELQLGWDLGVARVDETAVRCVPVTTALRRGSPPEAHAVVRGRLSRAICLSGSAPIAFAPMRSNGIRYADGAAAAPVPVRAAREYGADVVFACNSVPGPARGNPLGRSALGRFLHEHTLVGRALDLWVAGAFLVQQASQEASRDADVFFEPPPADVPFLESFQFYDAAGIARRSARTAAVRDAAARCEARWQRFAGARVRCA